VGRASGMSGGKKCEEIAMKLKTVHRYSNSPE